MNYDQDTRRRRPTITQRSTRLITRRSRVRIPPPRSVRCLGKSCTDVPGHPSRSGLPLVVAGGVEGQLADQLAGLVEDADVQVVHEDQDAGAGVASAES